MKQALVLLAMAAGLAMSARAQQASFPAPAWNRATAADQKHGSLVERGAAVSNNWCGVCQPAALEERRDLTDKLVKFYVRKGVATMPFFRKTEIGDTDLDALAAYLSQAKQ